MGVGRSFQIPQPFEGLTVFENLLTAACLRPRRKREARWSPNAPAVLEETELLHQGATVVAGLAEPARPQAAGTRRAPWRPAALLLLDEIAGGLTEAECQALVATDQAPSMRSGTTIIWIEHVRAGAAGRGRRGCWC